jgi:hypothetical protein
VAYRIAVLCRGVWRKRLDSGGQDEQTRRKLSNVDRLLQLQQEQQQRVGRLSGFR